MRHPILGHIAVAIVLAAVWVGRASAEEPAAAPKAISIGSQGTIQPGALLQSWFFLQKPASTSIYHQFRIRRTELKLKGEVVPKRFSFEVMIDPAQVLEKDKSQKITVSTKAVLKDAEGSDATISAASDTDLPKRFSILQDLSLTLKHNWCEFSIGQFKIPVSMEGYGGSSKLIFPERAMVSKTLGDKRDIGVRLAKAFPMFGYTLGVYNGSGQNTKDADDAKDVALRLEGYALDGLTLAAVYYQTLGGDGKKDQTEKKRVEADVKVEIGSALIQGEYIIGTDETKGVETKPRGFYALAGYTLGDFQPAVRFGQLDPNSDSASKDDDGTQIEAAVNYYIPGLKQHEGKIQLAGGQFSRGAEPKKDGPKEIQVTTAFQVAF